MSSPQPDGDSGMFLAIVNELIERAVAQSEGGPADRTAPPPASNEDAEEPTDAALQAAVDACAVDQVLEWLSDSEKKQRYKRVADCCVGSATFMAALIASLKASKPNDATQKLLSKVVLWASSLEPLAAHDGLLPDAVRYLGHKIRRCDRTAVQAARLLTKRSGKFVRLLAASPSVLTGLFCMLRDEQAWVRDAFMACLEKVADNPRFDVTAFAKEVAEEYGALPRFLSSIKCKTSPKVGGLVTKILAALPPLDDVYTAERSDLLKGDTEEVGRLVDRLSRSRDRGSEMTGRDIAMGLERTYLSDALKKALEVTRNGHPAIALAFIEPLTRVIGEPFVMAIRSLISPGSGAHPPGEYHHERNGVAFYMIKGGLARHAASPGLFPDTATLEAAIQIGGAPLAKLLNSIAKDDPGRLAMAAQVASVLNCVPSDVQSRASRTSEFLGEFLGIIHPAMKLAASPDADTAARSSALTLVANLTQTPAAEQRAARVVAGVLKRGQPLQHGVVSDVATVVGRLVSIEAKGPLDEAPTKFCNAISNLDRFGGKLDNGDGARLLPNFYEALLKQTAYSPPAIAELALGAGMQSPARRPALDLIDKSKQLFLQTPRVNQRLEDSFSTNRDRVVDARTLFELNIALGFTGTTRQILDQFADRLAQRLARWEANRASSPPTDNESKQKERERSQRIARHEKAINALRHPKVGLLNQFQLLQDGVEAYKQAQARDAAAAAPPLSGAGAAADQPAAIQQLAPPPGPPAPQAPLPAIAPPPATWLITDAEIFEYLDGKISLTPNCDKCEVARTDPAARLAYTEQGGRGVARDVSLKSACPLFEHGVSKKRLAELLDHVTSLGPYQKRQRADQYMRTKHDVTPLGTPDGAVPYNVSLYHLSQAGRYTPVDATGALSTGAAPPRHKEFYQGFQV